MTAGEYLGTFEKHWTRVTGQPMPDDWTTSVLTFYDRDVSIEVITTAVNAAVRARHVARADRWRYACGIIWRHVRAEELTWDL